MEVSADVYPYLASYTTIGIVFPEWAKTVEQFEEAKRTRNKELREYLFNRVQKRNGPESTLLAGNQYAGKTLEQAAADLQISFVDLLMQIGPGGGSGAYFIMEDSLMSTLLLHPEAMISSDGSPTMRHPRGHGTFARIIQRYVVRKQLAIEEAVRKMTALPAKTLGIERRGLLKAGNFADVVVFDPQNIKENATYLDPYRTASGFDEVLMNGISVVKQEAILSPQAGRLLRK
ncbi:MAG: amidohydrolase family protein [Cyclobacteriaceae bacterium]